MHFKFIDIFFKNVNKSGFIKLYVILIKKYITV